MGDLDPNVVKTAILIELGCPRADRPASGPIGRARHSQINAGPRCPGEMR